MTNLEAQEGERSAIQRALQSLVDLQKQVTYVDPESFTDEEALGVMIARYLDWDGDAIMRVAARILEDVNFHEEAALLRKISRA